MTEPELAGLEWEPFYRSEFERLVHSLTLYTGNAELAADLAQEAMARAWRHWSRVGKMNSPRGWTHRVALNLANSAWRRASRQLRLALQPEAASEDDTGTAMAVRAAVASLPRRQRTALVLRYLVDLPIDEVASLMGCAPETVRAHTRQGIHSLRSRAGIFLQVDEESI